MRRVLLGLVVLLVIVAGFWLVRALRRGGPEDAGPPPVADAASKRTLPAGEVVGFVGKYGSHAWLGLPYAKPPVGELRWRAPQPLEAWAGTREALSAGSPCPQYPSPLAGLPGDPAVLGGNEDCLFLNVYAPRRDPAQVPGSDALLPVMFWIHGGGNVIGLGDAYDGGRLAQEQNVVVVTVNYRLGPLGWFRNAALGGDPLDASGNYGTLDLVRALEWVRDNAAGFGGDSSRVTIFGESAGAHNVYTLLLSPRATGLFHRAISQSGGTWMFSAADAEAWHDDPTPGHRRSSNEILAKLLVKSGRAADRAAAKALVGTLTPEEIAAILRGASTEELFAAYERTEREVLLQHPRVIADGVVLPLGDALTHLARADGWNSVPVITGTNRDESKLFMILDPKYTRRRLWIFPAVLDPPLYLASAEASSNSWKVSGVDAPAAAMRATQPNVFAYRFDWDEEPTSLGFDYGAYLGAAHGLEIPFVFGTWSFGNIGWLIFNDDNAAGREKLARQMMSYWAEFAYNGAPGRGREGDQPEWQAWTEGDGAPKLAVLDSEAGGGVRMESKSLSVEDVSAAVSADPRLTTPKAKCWVFAEVFRFAPERYAEVESGLCKAFPLDEVPGG